MGLNERELRYRISLMNTVGPVTFWKLKDYYGSAFRIWNTEPPELTERQLTEWRLFHSAAKETELKEGYAALLHSASYRFVIPEDNEFPEALKWIPDPPVGIYVKGSLPEKHRPVAAVIGSRACSEYGKHQALKIAKELAESGVGVASGLAAGIDSFGHRGALEGNGYTVAVLGNGIDRCYPVTNLHLYETISEKGAVISEYPPGTPGRPMYFPLRNRIISGLSKLVVVIEAKKRSGSLITVERALEQGKDVMAVPGRLGDPLSEGCLSLIRQGAGIVTCTDDILFAMGIQTEKKKAARTGSKNTRLSREEQAVLNLMSTDPVHPDRLCETLDLPPGTLYMILFRLENEGLIRSAGPGLYAKT
ncbi:MAG: DNA-processing protein DprA [Lachnospiraceae bacterium]|nr:DNA-processing protein DprA [Lachnospiraceae bacterium]